MTMARTNAAFGIVISVLPPALAVHIFFKPSSPSWDRISFDVSTLLSCAARISSVEDGVGDGSPLNVVTSSAAHPQMTPGLAATCSASAPSDIDFGCGFHASLSDGTRSSTRRVVDASFSNSCRSALVMDMVLPPQLIGGEGFYVARTSFVKQNAAPESGGGIFTPASRRRLFVPVLVQRPPRAPEARRPPPLMAAAGTAPAGGERVPDRAAAGKRRLGAPLGPDTRPPARRRRPPRAQRTPDAAEDVI